MKREYIINWRVAVKAKNLERVFDTLQQIEKVKKYNLRIIKAEVISSMKK